MAEEEDEKMAESWKADAEGVLVFVSPYLHALHDSSLIGCRLVYSPLLSRR